MAEARRIGGDWVENTDPSSGKKYYANVTTQETRWTWPDDIPKEETSGGDDDWEERVDPGSGKTYYVNKKTQETQWTKPGTDATWIETADPASGRNYYINSVTNEVTWEKPAGFDSQSGGATTEDTKPEETQPEKAAATPATTEAAPKKEDKFAKLRSLKSSQSVKEGQGEAKTGPEHSKKEILDGGGHALSAAEQKKMNDINSVDIGEIEEAKMEEWAKPTEEGGLGKFNLDRKGIFGKRTKVTKILNFKKDLIKTALLKLNSSMNVEAVQAFKNVVSFMGDRSTRKDAGGHAQKLMKNTLHAPEELRDEIFCQIIKQVTNNPDPTSTSRGWQLMAIAAGTYPPSREFKPYLMYYCELHKNDPDGIGDLARGVQMRIKRIMDQGPRVNVPTDVEIEAVKHSTSVIMRVHLLDGGFAIVPVNSWTTVKEMHEMVTLKHNVRDGEPFAIYEISFPDEEERVLDETERVLDIVAYWQKTFDDDKAKNKKHDETYHFLYKVRLFLEPDPTDHAAVDLFYVQGVHDVVHARYPTSDQDCVTLGALQVQEKYGDWTPDCRNPLTGNMHKFISKKFLSDKLREQEMEDNVMQVWKKLAGKTYTSRDAKQNYLDYIKAWKIYGSTYFVVEPQSSRDFPKEVVLAINAQRVLIVHPQSQEFLAEYPYNEVVTWGQSSKSFVLVTGNLVRQQKVYFRTEQGKDMNALVHAYVNKIIGK